MESSGAALFAGLFLFSNACTRSSDAAQFAWLVRAACRKVGQARSSRRQPDLKRLLGSDHRIAGAIVERAIEHAEGVHVDLENTFLFLALGIRLLA